MKKLEKNKKLETIGAICFIVCFIICLVFLGITILKQLELKFIIIFCAIGFGFLFVGTSVALVCDFKSGTWRCPSCGTKFKPKFIEYLFAYHTTTKRLLKCPNCHGKHLCEKKLD